MTFLLSPYCVPGTILDMGIQLSTDSFPQGKNGSVEESDTGKVIVIQIN